jgi:CRISPR-associated protein Cas2
MRLAVIYDIGEDKIRNRVFKILKRYGAWRQYSVFELEINDIQRLSMEN